ncbi:unnamed protein product, partial [Ectocarpus sp. 4 AP-2014]
LSKEDNTYKPIKAYKVLLRIAAVVVIGFGLYFALLNEDLTKINTLVAETTNFSLPDNSEITVNADSKIAYNKEKWNKNRKLSLDGEAFFKVAKGAKFEVKTDIGTVTVLGTRFNVKQRGKLLEVQCFEGLVNVTIDTVNNKLRAGETLLFTKSKLVMGRTSLTKPSWVNGKSS